MKRLFRHIIVFIVPFLVLTIIVVMATRRYLDNDDFYRLSPGTHTIVLGHSQTECGFNDRLVRGTENFSQGGEAYLYTYLKLKKLIDANPGLKNVVISLSNNQIQSKMDEWTWGEENMYNYYPKYAFMMDSDDYKVLYSNNPKTALASEAKMVKLTAGLALKRDANLLDDRNWGGYLHLKRQKLDSLMNSDFLIKQSKQDFFDRSDVNIEYLEEIRELCKKHNVKMFLIRMPVHKMWVFRRNEELFKQIRQRHFSDVHFLDFQDFPLKNAEMGDFDHLNFDGAKKFSLFFGDLMQRGLLESADPQTRIDDAVTQLTLKDSIPEK